MKITESSKSHSSAALVAMAVGAVAVGAFAIGALAIGRLVVRRITVDSAKFKSLEIEELVVTRLRAGEVVVADSSSFQRNNRIAQERVRDVSVSVAIFWMMRLPARRLELSGLQFLALTLSCGSV